MANMDYPWLRSYAKQTNADGYRFNAVWSIKGCKSSFSYIIDQDNKYIIVTSRKPIVEIEFKLDDLKSRAKNFISQKIDKPDDELIYALILKNLSDRQILIEKKLINYIIKRIYRSYSKIYDFIYKIDELSLKKKKSIDLKIIKEVLGD